MLTFLFAAQVLDECHHTYSDHPFNAALAHYRQQSPAQRSNTQVRHAELVYMPELYPVQNSAACALSCAWHSTYSIAGSLHCNLIAWHAVYIPSCTIVYVWMLRTVLWRPADHWSDGIAWRGQQRGELSHLCNLSTSLLVTTASLKSNNACLTMQRTVFGHQHSQWAVAFFGDSTMPVPVL